MPENQELVKNISVFSRYSLHDKFIDSNIEIPNRRFWTINKLYIDWKEKGFFDVLSEYGFITVSYNNLPFIEFAPSVENMNRHEAVSLSFFLSSRYNKINICSPHENNLVFSAIFEFTSDNEIIYTSEYGDVVRFHFDINMPSQFVAKNK